MVTIFADPMVLTLIVGLVLMFLNLLFRSVFIHLATAVAFVGVVLLADDTQEWVRRVAVILVAMTLLRLILGLRKGVRV